MLLVHVPDTYVPERSYIIRILMHDFLGLETQLQIEERKDVLVENNITKNGRTLRMADVFFQTPEDRWLTRDSLPLQPLMVWDLANTYSDIPMTCDRLPVIYGCKSKSYLAEDEDGVYLGLDIFGSAFFMLTRYEEYVKPDRDEHDRFPASASLAYQEGFLDRPIINEYLEILWQQLHRIWPGLERKKYLSKTILSHDVDIPFAQVGTNIARLGKSCCADILIRKSPALALQRFNIWQAVKRGDYKQDQNYTFDRLMDISEKNNLKSAFYFMTASTNPTYDPNCYIDHPYIRQLLRDIHNRGHEIGLHPSYEAFKDTIQTRLEYNKLRQICAEINIQQNCWGGRQHYLRWQAVTWRNWSAAGLNYDSTLTYPEQAGFRCGICYDFQVYDLEQHKELPLIERPLIVMEESVTREKYMGLTDHNIFDYMNKMKHRCLMFNGNFTLLWHNQTLHNAQMWEFFQGLAASKA